MPAHRLIVAAASAVAVIAAPSGAQAPFGPCPIGYVIEEVPLSDSDLTLMIAEDGTVLAEGKLYRSGEGVIVPPFGLRPYCVNSTGVMAAKTSEGITIFDMDHIIATVPCPPEAERIWPEAISDSGYVVGGMEIDEPAQIPYYRGFRINPDLSFEVLDQPQNTSCYANAVNIYGQVAGRCSGDPAYWESDGTFHRVVMEANNEGVDIDDQGEMLIQTIGVPPALWSPGTGLRSLTDHGLDAGFWPWGMNLLDHVVGDNVSAEPWILMDGTYSFLQAALVNGDGWDLAWARGINDAGQIVGIGSHNGVHMCYLLTPVGLCGSDVTTAGAAPNGLGYGVPDGETNTSDLNYFVNAWVAGDTNADITTMNAPAGDPAYGQPDGLVTAADLQHYVNLWINGCS